MNDDVTRLYGALIDGWNANDAAQMAACLTADALVIGYDGSEMVGRDEVESQLGRVFVDHRTAKYVYKVRSVRSMGADAALLHAVVGMVPASGDGIIAERNAIQTVVARRGADGWLVALFQTTPAQFHGRPADAVALTAELSEVLEQEGVGGRR